MPRGWLARIEDIVLLAIELYERVDFDAHSVDLDALATAIKRKHRRPEGFERTLKAVPRLGQAWQVKEALQLALEGLAPNQLSEVQRVSLICLRDELGEPLVSAVERDWPKVREYWSSWAPPPEVPQWQRAYAWIKGSKNKAELILREEQSPRSRKILEKKLKRLEGEVLEAVKGLPRSTEATAVDVLFENDRLTGLRFAKS